MAKKLSLNIFKNDYTLSLFDKVFSIVIGVISSAFYIRYLGLEHKGTYSYINEVCQIAGLIINFGIYQSYPFNFRKKGHEIYPKYVNTFLLQFLIFEICAFICMYIFRDNMVVFLIFLELPFLVLKTQMDNIMIVEKIKLFMWTDIGLKTVLTVVYFILWKFCPVHVSYVVVSVAVTNLLVCVNYLIFSNYKPSLDIFNPDMVFIKDVLAFGFIPMLSTLLITLNYSLDIVFLEHMGDPIELSLYSTAAVLINYVWIIPNAFKEVLTSRVARKDAQDQVAFSVKVSILITFVILIGFIIFGKLAIRIVFGADFVGCYLVTLLLFLGAFSMIFFKMLGVVYIAEGNQKPYFIILLVSVIVNVVVNYLTIPSMGMYGAAIASIASYNFCGIIFLVHYCRWKQIKVSNFVMINKEDIQSLLSLIK